MTCEFVGCSQPARTKLIYAIFVKTPLGDKKELQFPIKSCSIHANEIILGNIQHIGFRDVYYCMPRTKEQYLLTERIERL